MLIFEKIFDLIINDNFILNGILKTTFQMALSSSLIAVILGVPLGIFLGFKNNHLTNFFILINRTLMGVPPVVCGLFCFLLFCGVGPLRHLKLLFTVGGMVVAQVILITPIVVGTIEPYIKSTYPIMHETFVGLKLINIKKFFLIISESKYQIISVYLIALSRALAEVGAVSMVGGAIVFKTDVMTTAIMKYTNMGDFNMAMALGVILLAISFIINLIVVLLGKKYA